MREPLIIRPQEGPIANLFNDVMKVQMAHPAYEAQYKGQQAALAAAKTREADAAFNAAGMQRQTMADILQQHLSNGNAVVPWTNPDTGAVVQNTDPSAPMETPADRAARIQPMIGSAMTGPGVTKDMAEQFREALSAAKAVGTSDEARQSMVLGGHSVDQNFAPTGADAAAVQHRNAWDVPLTDAQVKGKYTQLLWDKLSDRQKANVIDANKSGMNLSMGPDGTTTMTSGGPGTFQPGDFGGPAVGTPATSPLGPMTNTTLSTMQGKTLQNQALIDRLTDYAKLVANSPDSHFGVAGKGQVLAGDVASQVKGLSDFTKSLGIKNTSGFADQIKNAALANGADANTVNSLFAGTPEIMSLENLHNSLIGPVAQAISGAEGGRQPAEAYTKIASEMLENPTALGAGKIKTLQALKNLVHDTRISQNAYSGKPSPVDQYLSQFESVAPVSAVAPAVAPMSAPATSTDAQGNTATVVSEPIAALSNSAVAPVAPQPADPAATFNATPTAAGTPPVVQPDVAASPSGPIQVKSKADLVGMAPGTVFIDPNGVQRVIPHVQVPGSAPPVGSTPAGGQY